MGCKRKRTTTRRRPPAKRPRRVTYSQVGGVSPGLIVGIGKAGYGITKAIGEHQQKRAKKISDKRWRDYLSGKRKSYGGESFNCSLMLKKRIKRPGWTWTRVSWKMVRGPNGRRHRYVPRIRRRRRGLQRGGVLPMLAVALSPWAFKKKKRQARRR